MMKRNLHFLVSILFFGNLLFAQERINTFFQNSIFDIHMNDLSLPIHKVIVYDTIIWELIPKKDLKEYGLQLGGLGRKDTVILADMMGYYWMLSDTLKANYKEPDEGNQRHLVGSHIWSSGDKDSINLEPTYMIANTYESNILMNCKCVKNRDGKKSNGKP
jgi:hypothetical protein